MTWCPIHRSMRFRGNPFVLVGLDQRGPVGQRIEQAALGVRGDAALLEDLVGVVA